jgi:hypothetical protein
MTVFLKDTVIEGDLTVTGTIFLGGIGDVAGGDLTGTYPNPSIASNAVTSAKIADGTIVNGDINSAAAIDYSKLNIPASSIEGSKMNRHIGSSPPRLSIGWRSLDLQRSLGNLLAVHIRLQ